MQNDHKDTKFDYKGNYSDKIDNNYLFMSRKLCILDLLVQILIPLPINATTRLLRRTEPYIFRHFMWSSCNM